MAQPNNRVLVEVAVDSLAGAVAAVAAGADRLELCQALELGGLTPSAGLFAAVRAAVRVPVFAMARPRAGDFLWRAEERATVAAEIEALRAAGADGIVTGALLADGRIDVDAMRDFVRRAGPLPVTCHRAFDHAADAAQAFADLRAAGVARVLTSGQAPAAPAGAATIARLVALGGAPIVVAGGGVRADNVAALVAATGVAEVHVGAAGTQPSAMQHRRSAVRVGAGPLADDLVRVTDPTMVAGVVAALRRSAGGGPFA